MLEKKIIRPPTGQDYKKVSGELSVVLDGLIAEHFGDYLLCPEVIREYL